MISIISVLIVNSGKSTVIELTLAIAFLIFMAMTV